MFKVLVEIDWIVDKNTIVHPDLCVVEGEIPVEYLKKRPVLITEITSNSTVLKDRTAKFELYQSQEIPYYLISDPANQQLQIFRLVDGQYQPQNFSSSFLFELNDQCLLDVDLGT